MASRSPKKPPASPSPYTPPSVSIRTRRTRHERSRPPTPCGSGPSRSIVRTSVIFTSAGLRRGEREVHRAAGLRRELGRLGHLDRGAAVLAGDRRPRPGPDRLDEVDQLACGVADPARVTRLEVGERPAGQLPRLDVAVAGDEVDPVEIPEDRALRADDLVLVVAARAEPGRTDLVGHEDLGDGP